MENERMNKFRALRRKAEQRLEESDGGRHPIPEDMEELIHELEVHQEELKIQNEELKSANEEISQLHREYSDLYEFAPFGYLVLTPAGIIERINLSGTQLLGEDRQHVHHMRFSAFLEAKSQTAFYSAAEGVRKSGEKEGVELEVKDGESDSGSAWLRADIAADYSETGELSRWRLTLVDISRRRKSEAALQSHVNELEAIYTHMPVLLFLLDGERNIRKSNAYVSEFTDLSQERMRGIRPGDALQCLHHLDDPQGCGFGPHCSSCRLRSLLLDTLKTGRSHDREEVEVFVGGGQDVRRLTFLLSTTPILREQGQCVLLALEEITMLKQRERELRKSEEKFHAIFESTNDAIFIHDFDGHFLEVNEVACRYLGYSREELLERRVADIESRKSAALIRERMETVRQAGSTVFETVHLRKDGTEIPVEVGSRSFEFENTPGVLSVARDITERKKAQESLRLFRNQLLTILENLEAGVFVLSLKTGKVLYANSYMKRVFGEELVGRRCHEVLGYKDHMCPYCPNYLYGASGGSEPEPLTFYEYRPPESSTRYMMHVRPITWVDTTQATITIFTDITPFKEAEELRDDIDRITRHDLKSPLNGILGAAQLIRSDASLPEEYREYGEIIEESGRNMLRLIDESLSIYKMEKDVYELEPEEVDIEELLRLIIRSYEQRPEAKGVQLAFENDTAAGGRIEKAMRGEYLLCYSLFSNLIMNAIEASEKGDTVRILADRENSAWINVSVWNRKPLPREIREHFADKYATHGKKRGTGLGLYSARLMAETQGGTISWSSSEEEGTTITVTLPAVNITQ